MILLWVILKIFHNTIIIGLISQFHDNIHSFQNHAPLSAILNGPINIITLKFCIIVVSLLAFEKAIEV